ncbi:unnamed protein product [Toxocara canis]|uniref:RWD domain-containing protein n=1 Tax=Toxocara canis TaxID=6265 RepID=A0A183U4Z3_TOXCA|nr:unnamed protein product [Toxocara canis]
MNRDIISIKRGTKEVEVNYLPPLTLTFDLPYDYPSSSAPRFSIRAAWIGRTEREQLCTSLKNCWYDYPGMPILFTWIQTLQEEATKLLAAKSKIDLDQIDQVSAQNRH